MKSKILLLLSLIFIITACDSGPDKYHRTKSQRDQISEWREKGYFVVDASILSALMMKAKNPLMRELCTIKSDAIVLKFLKVYTAYGFSNQDHLKTATSVSIRPIRIKP